MKDFKKIKIQKNRGWRGLAKAIITDKDDNEITSMVFSFSQKVWEDMLHGYIVIPHEEYYYILTFDNTDKLPTAEQQRSVLIKNFQANITEHSFIEKDKWHTTNGVAYSLLFHHVKNNNRHTTSDWNFIGVRVIPEI